MKKRNHHSGFTLIEIIVVLIIVGILAVISIQTMMSWIERSYASEAAPIVQSIASAIDGCIAAGQTASNCITVSQAGGPVGSIAVCSMFCLAQPVFTSATTTHFVYTYAVGAASGFPDPTYAILALRENQSGGWYNLVTNGGFFAGPTICGTDFTTNGNQQYIVLCRDAAGNHTIQGIGYYQGLY